MNCSMKQCSAQATKHQRPFGPSTRLPSQRRVTRVCRAEPEQQSTSTKTQNELPPIRFKMDPSTLEDRVRLRSEAEAPWRAVRFVFLGSGLASAGLGFLVSIPQLIGALGGAPNALPKEDVLQNLAINAGAAAVCAFFLNQDLKARDKQMARLTREESLSACVVQLANGKKRSLAALRGNARVVVCAGTQEQIKSALEAAEPYKAELQRRGVLVVPCPIYEPTDSTTQLPDIAKEDLRWIANAVKLDIWKDWFAQQLSFSSKATSDKGLYVSLRKDGRVRGSGMGSPPWAMLAAQLPPEEGMWTGLLDGMDGKV